MTVLICKSKDLLKRLFTNKKIKKLLIINTTRQYLQFKRHFTNATATFRIKSSFTDHKFLDFGYFKLFSNKC